MLRPDVLYTGKHKPVSHDKPQQTASPDVYFQLGSCAERVPQVSASGGFVQSWPGSDPEQGCSDLRICSRVQCSSCKVCSSRVNWPCLVRISSLTWAHDNRAAAEKHWLYSYGTNSVHFWFLLSFFLLTFHKNAHKNCELWLNLTFSQVIHQASDIKSSTTFNICYGNKTTVCLNAEFNKNINWKGSNWQCYIEKEMQHMLTQSEDRRLELLQGQVVHCHCSGRFGLHLVTFLQKDRQTLAIFFQCRVTRMKTNQTCSRGLPFLNRDKKVQKEHSSCEVRTFYHFTLFHRGSDRWTKVWS